MNPTSTVRVAISAALALLIALTALAAVTTRASAEGESPLRMTRLAGDSREGTAVAISQRAFPDGADIVYLARSDNPVDANVAGTLTDGPILLIPSCGAIPDVVGNELARLNPNELVALGGPAAICETVFNAAADATRGVQTDDPDGPEVVEITADLELVTVDGDPVDPASIPYIATVTDPGTLREGETATHEVQVTSTDDIELNDPRFGDVMTNDSGQLVATGLGCGPNHRDGRTTVICQDNFVAMQIPNGETTSRDVTLHTDNEVVGPTPIQPGTYTNNTLVSWGPLGEFDYGPGIFFRITYTVTAA